MMIHAPTYRDQKGTVLVIALILLLVLTIIGVTSIQSTSLDEHIAANSRVRNLAFQAAESALKEAEDRIMYMPKSELINILSEQPLDPYNDTAWKSLTYEKIQTYSGPIHIMDNDPDTPEPPDAIIDEPTYVIEKISDYDYRVTAYGQGSTDTAVVVLEMVVKRKRD